MIVGAAWFAPVLSLFGVTAARLMIDFYVFGVCAVLVSMLVVSSWFRKNIFKMVLYWFGCFAIFCVLTGMTQGSLMDVVTHVVDARDKPPAAARL